MEFEKMDDVVRSFPPREATDNAMDSLECFRVLPVADSKIEDLKDITRFVYLYSTNSLLVQDSNGRVHILDASFDNMSIVATYQLPPDVHISYNKYSDKLIVVNSQTICMRSDLNGCYFLRTASKSANKTDLSVEMAVEEASSFLAAASISNEEMFVNRPKFSLFLERLREQVDAAAKNARETVAIDVDGSGLMEELKPQRSLAENVTDEMGEWPLPLWPFVSALGERLCLLLCPGNPYNFESSSEFKIIDKSVMVSEAARRLTFGNWPHTDCRWALPYQMAEAGFYHQPNKTGDDRALCFACMICLVCWEPSDEPWSEHERHSPNCRFLRNDLNPNVPLVVTYSALAPTPHRLNLSETKSLVVSTTSNCEWIAMASKQALDIKLWRVDCVMQWKLSISLDFDVLLMFIHDCTSTDVQRRNHRVTWSDDFKSCVVNTEQSSMNTGFTKVSRISTDSMNPTMIRITSLCVVGRSCNFDQFAYSMLPKNSLKRGMSMLVVGIAVDPKVLKRRKVKRIRSEAETEVSALNSMNSACEIMDSTPRIVDEIESLIPNAKKVSSRPLIVVYSIENDDKDGQSGLSKSRADTENAEIEKYNSISDESMQTALIIDPLSDKSVWVDVSGSEVNPNESFNDDVWSTNTKSDDKSDCIVNSYDFDDVTLNQCVKLPLEVNNNYSQIVSITPMQNQYLIVVVNSDNTISDSIRSGILVYRIIFDSCVYKIQSPPILAYYYREFQIEQLETANMEILSDDALLATDILDGVVIKTSDNMAYFINLNNNGLLKLSNERIKHIAAVENGRCILQTDSSRLLTVQIEQILSRQVDDEEEEKISVDSLIASDQKVSKEIISECAECEDPVKVCHDSVLKQKSVTEAKLLSIPLLKRMWKMTKSDPFMYGHRASLFQIENINSSRHPKFQLALPPCWTEVSWQQKYRKNPLRGIHEDTNTRTWTHQYITRSNFHQFGLLFQQGIELSHLNIRLSFHSTCKSCPNVELSVYRRKSLTGWKAKSSMSMAAEAEIKENSEQLSLFEAQHELIAGPYHCSEYIELNEGSSFIQIPGYVFSAHSSQADKFEGKKSAYHFVLIIKALSDHSLDQLFTAAIINDREKTKSSGSSCKSKSSKISKRIDHLPESLRSCTGSTSDKKMSNGCNRVGMQCVQELSISLVNAKRAMASFKRFESNCVINDAEIHRSLFATAAGLLPPSAAQTVGEKMLRQNIALDVLIWLVDNWRNTSSHLLQKIDDGPYFELLLALLDSSKQLVEQLHSIKNAGSLRWFCLLIFSSLKAALTEVTNQKCLEAANSLFAACVCSLSQLGSAHKKVWEGSVHEKLANLYGFSGLPLDLVMFDWPSQVLSIWPRSCSNNAPGGSSVMASNILAPSLPPPANMSSIAKWSTMGSKKILSEMKNSPHVIRNRGDKTHSGKYKIDICSFLSEIGAEDELGWPDLFGIPINVTKESSEADSDGYSSTKYQNPMLNVDGVAINGAGYPSNQLSNPKNRTLLSSSHLCGLLEVEPLSFSCIAASDFMRIETMDSEPNSSTVGPNMTTIETSTPEDDGSPYFSHVENIPSVGTLYASDLKNLSKNLRKSLIAMGQDKDIVAPANDSTIQTLASISIESVLQGTATQGSSASTFGIPTTPKTTPFMTPTPLSPSHLSPINSEANLTSLIDNGNAEQDERSGKQCTIVPSVIPQISADDFQPPPQKVLILDRMTVGARKFVVIDFGSPVMLTDVFIPSVGELSSVAIDVWLNAEFDGQRLLLSNDIGQRNIVLHDIQMATRIRYMKLTYVGQQTFGSICRVPIGSFFGHRYFPCWQTYTISFAHRERSTDLFNTLKKEMSDEVNCMRQLCEDIRCRYQIVSSELIRLVNERAPAAEVKCVYQLCMQLRLQWNMVHGIIRRSELENIQLKNETSSTNGSWRDCYIDQLRVNAYELLTLLTQVSQLADVRELAMNSCKNNLIPIKLTRSKQLKMSKHKFDEEVDDEYHANCTFQSDFTLDQAIQQFLLFCAPRIPKLQVACITWLLHRGSEAKWWPYFFPRVLREIFATQQKKTDEKTFLLLSFLCNHSVKSSSNQAQIFLTLFEFINEIVGESVDGDGKYIGVSTKKLDTSLLSWSLMLLSSALDVVIENRKNGDRWAFLGGDYAHFSSFPEKTQDQFIKNLKKCNKKSQLENFYQKHLETLKNVKEDASMTLAINEKLEKLFVLKHKLNSLSTEAKAHISASDPEIFELPLPYLPNPEDYIQALIPFAKNPEQLNDYLEAQNIAAKLGPYISESVDSSTLKGDGPFGSSKHGGRATRAKQSNIRLKLPFSSCSMVSKNLLHLLCSCQEILPSVTKLIICKVVARICVNASHFVIPLIHILNGPIDQLLQIGLCQQSTDLMTCAVLHLLLDVIEAESKAAAKTYSAPKGNSVEKSRDVALENFSLKVTGLHYSILAEHARNRIVSSSDIDARKSSGYTAETSGLPEPFASSKTSNEFSVANYDEKPDDASKKHLVVEALTLVGIINKPGADPALRLTAFMDWACSLILQNLEKGGCFGFIFRWIDALRQIEAQVVDLFTDKKSYLDLLWTQKVSCSSYKASWTPISESALTACLQYEKILLQKKIDFDTMVLDSEQPGPSSSCFSHMYGILDSEHSSVEKYGANDLKENDSLKTITDFADDVSGNITKDATTVAEKDEDTYTGTSKLEKVETVEGQTTADHILESSAQQYLSKWKPSKLFPTYAHFNQHFHLKHFMLNYLVDLRMSRNDYMIQPCIWLVDEQYDEQLGLSEKLSFNHSITLADTISRFSIRNLKGWRTPVPNRMKFRDEYWVRGQVGETFSAVIEALGRFMDTITVETSCDDFQRLIAFYLDFQSGLTVPIKRCPNESKCVSSFSFVSAIVGFAISSKNINEYLWTLILRIIHVVVASDIAIAEQLISSDKFCELLVCFILQSIVRLNDSLAVGPVLVQTFKRLITHLHEIPWKSVVCAKILTALTEIFNRHGDLICFSYPIEILTELRSIMKKYTEQYSMAPVECLALFISATTRCSRKYILHCSNSPVVAFSSSDMSARPNVCFQALQKIEKIECTEKSDPEIPNPKLVFLPETSAHYSKWLKLTNPQSSNQTTEISRIGTPNKIFLSAVLCEVTFYKIIGNSVKISMYIDRQPDLVDYILLRHSSVVDDLFEIISACECTDANINALKSDSWRRISLGDQALWILLQMSKKVDQQSLRLFEVAISAISRHTDSKNKLSMPFSFAIVQLLSKVEHRKSFAELGGHLLVARELKRCILASTTYCVAPVSTPFMQQLAFLSAHVAGGCNDFLPQPKESSDVKQDGLCNYAPYCYISSEMAPNTHRHFVPLVFPNQPRRTRSSNWSYHFPEDGSDWLDLLFTLPYQVILEEVVIRSHIPALNNAPAAVQLEVCSDVSLANWRILGPPLPTCGSSKIRISMNCYKLPIMAVRIYLKRAPDSPNLNLAQILLIGRSLNNAIMDNPTEDTSFTHWLLIMDNLYDLADYSIWNYAADLPSVLVRLFLERPLADSIYMRVVSLLKHVDDDPVKSRSVVELVFQQIEGSESISSSSLPWLPELLFSLCCADHRTETEVSNKYSIDNQNHMLKGFRSLMLMDKFNAIADQEMLAVLSWTAACIIWSNTGHDVMHYQTVCACIEIATNLKRLSEIAHNVDETYTPILAKSTSWLLCSIVRAVPRLLSNVLNDLKLLNQSHEPDLSMVSAFNVVRRMCQSSTAVQQLVPLGLLDRWVELINAYCSEDDLSHLAELTSIVRCFASLSHIETIVRYLDSPNVGPLFSLLLNYVIRCALGASELSRSMHKCFSDLEDATVKLITRCVSFDFGHRQKIATILSTLLKTNGVNGVLQQLMLKCIFDDEKVVIKVTDCISQMANLSIDLSGRIVHPFFGCTLNIRRCKVSMYTTFCELTKAFAVHLNKPVTDRYASKQTPFDEMQPPSTNDVLPKRIRPVVPLLVNYHCSNGTHQLPYDYKISDILKSLKNAGRQRHKKANSNLDSFLDISDGYFTANLFISAIYDTTQKKAKWSDDKLPNASEQMSTLQHFARTGGLATLAQYLQLHHRPASQAVPVNSLVTKKTKPFGSTPMIPTDCVISTTNEKVMKIPTNQNAANYTAFLVAETAANGDNFEFIDAPTSINFEAMNVSSPSTPFPDASMAIHGGSFQSSHAKCAPVPPKPPASDTLPPHVVVAFSVFLCIEGYAELLITYDRKQAKRLLRMAMGVASPELVSIQNRLQSYKRSDLNNISILLDEDQCCSSLGLLPFIILEELFKTNPPSSTIGRIARETTIRYGVLDILLICLAHYSHQEPLSRSLRQNSLVPAPEVVNIVQYLISPPVAQEVVQSRTKASDSANMPDTSQIEEPTSKQSNFWAKGTGFGSGTIQQQWNVDLHVMKRQNDEQAVMHLLRVLSNFINPEIAEILKNFKSDDSSKICDCEFIPGELVSACGDASAGDASSSMGFGERFPSVTEIKDKNNVENTFMLNSSVSCVLSRSCLLPTIWSYIRNDSVLEMSKHVDVYEAAVHLVAALSLTQISNESGKEVIAQLFPDHSTAFSIQALYKKLQNLYDCISVYFSKLPANEGEPKAESNVGASEEGLMRLMQPITVICSVLAQHVKESPINAQLIAKTVATAEDLYVQTMKNLQFDTIPFFAESAYIPYHFGDALITVGTSAAVHRRTRRLAQEIVTLSNSLPLSASSSVFVRAAEERLDVMKVLITGPADTPYMNGCFEFDVWFPSDYPNSPMHINLITTGNHSVRFNPNLYNDGKVCLSVLNTWHGRPEERWNSKASSLLQVIVSIQSLILVPDPYFNEPGYERTRCTPSGQQASRDYDAGIRQATVRWAMLDMIQSPPTAFADVVRKHFWLKRTEIIKQLYDWIREGENNSSQNQNNSRTQTHFNLLKRHVATLSEEFAKMKCPDDLEEKLPEQTGTSCNVVDVEPNGTAQAATGDADSVNSLASMKILKL